MKIGPINVRPFVMVLPEYPEEKTVAIQKHLRSVGIEAEEFACVCAYDPVTKEPVAGLSENATLTRWTLQGVVTASAQRAWRCA